MKHNIVLAGRTDHVPALNQLASQLRGAARLATNSNPANVSVVTDIETVDQFISDEEVTTLVIFETINSTASGNDVTISQTNIKTWKTAYPNMLVVLIVDDSKKGGIKLDKLYKGGYYNALYISNFSQDSIISLIKSGGREETNAYDYYGLMQGNFDPRARRADDDVDIEIEEPAAPVEEKPRSKTRRKEPQTYGFTQMEELIEDEEYVREDNKKKSPSPAVREDDYEDEDEDEEEERPRKKKARPIQKRQPSPAPAKKRRHKEEDYEDEDYDEEEYEEEEDDEDEEERPRRRSARSRRKKSVPLFPMYDYQNIYFGEVEEVEDGDTLIVKVPLPEGTVLDEEFIGTKVFFMASTE